MTHNFSLISLEFSLRILNDTRHTGTLNRAGLGFEYILLLLHNKTIRNQTHNILDNEIFNFLLLFARHDYFCAQLLGRLLSRYRPRSLRIDVHIYLYQGVTIYLPLPCVELLTCQCGVCWCCCCCKWCWLACWCWWYAACDERCWPTCVSSGRSFPRHEGLSYL